MASLKKLMRQEARAESRAMYEMWARLSFIEAVAKHPREPLPVIYPSFEIKKDRKGNEIGRKDVLVQVQDIVSIKTWKKFLLFKGYVNEQLIRLTEQESLAEAYYLWLFTHYTDRYRNLDGEGLAWLKKIALRAVVWLTGENKLRGWMQCEDRDNPDEDYWVNTKIGYLYEYIYAMRTIGQRGNAQIISRVADKPEDKDLRQELRQSYRDENDESLEGLRKSLKEEVGQEEAYWEEEEKKQARQQRAGEAAS